MKFDKLIEYIRTVYENDYLLKKLSDDKNLNTQKLMDHYFIDYFIPEIKILLEKSDIQFSKDFNNEDLIISNGFETYKIATTIDQYRNNGKKIVWKINNLTTSRT